MPRSLWLFFTAYRAYPDRPCSRSPLAIEGYFNAQHTKERLRATHPASEGAGIFWPVRALSFTGKGGGGTQKIRSRSRPAAAVGHKSPDANCHWVCLDDRLDCGFAVPMVTKAHEAFPDDAIITKTLGILLALPSA